MRANFRKSAVVAPNRTRFVPCTQEPGGSAEDAPNRGPRASGHQDEMGTTPLNISVFVLLGPTGLRAHLGHPRSSGNVGYGVLKMRWAACRQQVPRGPRSIVPVSDSRLCRATSDHCIHEHGKWPQLSALKTATLYRISRASKESCYLRKTVVSCLRAIGVCTAATRLAHPASRDHKLYK